MYILYIVVIRTTRICINKNHSLVITSTLYLMKYNIGSETVKFLIDRYTHSDSVSKCLSKWYRVPNVCTKRTRSPQSPDNKQSNTSKPTPTCIYISASYFIDLIYNKKVFCKQTSNFVFIFRSQLIKHTLFKTSVQR